MSTILIFEITIPKKHVTKNWQQTGNIINFMFIHNILEVPVYIALRVMPKIYKKYWCSGDGTSAVCIIIYLSFRA